MNNTINFKQFEEAVKQTFFVEKNEKPDFSKRLHRRRMLRENARKVEKTEHYIVTEDADVDNYVVIDTPRHRSRTVLSRRFRNR